MATLPPALVVEAYLDSIGRITRRIEIYEADGKTLWEGYPNDESFLIDGTVSVDYDKDERRSLDLTLDNTLRYFDSTPEGFWYDKIIKAYRGIEINQKAENPRVIVITDSNSEFMLIRNQLNAIGYTDLYIDTSAATLDDLAGFDIVVANDGILAPTKATLINQAWSAGFNILTMGSLATQAHYPSVMTTTNDLPQPIWFLPVGTSSLARGWTQWKTTETGTTKVITSWPSAAYQFAADGYSVGGVFASAIAREAPVTAARWVHLASSLMIGTQAGLMLQQVMRYLNPTPALSSWETQIGEFMIDSIEEDNFPHKSKIKGRDYTKKLILAQFLQTTQFKSSIAGNTVEAIIRNVAINGGIDPKRISITPISSTPTKIPANVTFDRGTTRWAAVKKMANDYSYEIFFDHVGTLIVRPFQDPTSGSPVFRFLTGEPSGSLVNYTKSANDSSLFNSILCAGESSDNTVVPKYATAKNTDPKSPSNIASLGERVFIYTSPLLTTVAQCQTLANKYLSIYALEEYEMNFGAITLDWLEAGDIIDVVPQRIVAGTPTRFLLTSFSLPLVLGAMTGVGKRMLIVS